MSALLDLRGVSVALRGRDVVSDASLIAAPGAICALIGPNGAGKSTLLRASLGLTPVGAGRALLGGADVAALPPRERARRAAYLPQAPESAWPLSVEALAALGRFAFGAAPNRLSGADLAAVDRALALVKLEGLRDRPIDSLSGGERARAHLARVLAQGAPLLALDEPTAELDPAHALAVLDAVKAHADAGGGVLLTTHDVAFAARIATSVHVMRDGRIIAAGPPKTALTDETLHAAYGRAGRMRVIDGAPAVTFF